MSTTRSILDTHSTARRDRLLGLSTPASFPAGTRIFYAGQAAERFWVLGRSQVTLDMHVPGRQAAVVQTVSAGELLGWSWLFPPFRWQLGAEAHTTVQAREFPAAAVRGLCSDGPFGIAHSSSLSVGSPECDS